MLIVVLAGLVAASCAPRPAVTAVQHRPEAPPEVVLHLSTGLDHPAASITYPGSTQDASVGSYCWTRPAGGESSVSQCVDTTGENILVASYLEVPPGTILRIDGAPSEISGRLGTVIEHGNHFVELQTVQELSLSGGSDRLEADPGDYTLDLFVHWDHGDAGLAFGIRITAA